MIDTNLLVTDNSGSPNDRLSHVKGLLDLEKWKVVFDIGACDGVEGIAFATLLPNCQVYSFEPSSQNQLRCSKNYATLDPEVRYRVHLVSAALGETTGAVTFHAIDEDRAREVGNVNYGMGSLLEIVDPRVLPWELNVQKTVEVNGYRLDDWCSYNQIEKVDAIWMDVQGAELMVLKGATSMLENVEVIMTEAGIQPYYHGHTMKADIDEFLFKNGFVELTEASLNHAQGLEVNTIYVNKRFM